MAAGLYDITNEILGKGHFAIVKLARHCLTGEHVAIKIVDKMKLTKEGLEQLSCEIKLWSILSRHEHPNVVKLYQCIDTRTKLYLVMEYCGNDVCDLYDHIQKKNDGTGLDEDEARYIFRQICNAIFHCHSLKIVHRDLKPENILIIGQNQKLKTAPEEEETTDTGQDLQYPTVKLIDFGFSNQWAEDVMLRTSCGSLAYSAPEILLGNEYDGPKVDIWGLGCILYILLYGHNPFMQFNDNETLIKILDCSFTTPEKSSVNELSLDLIKSLLKKEPNQRLTIDQIINHPWLKPPLNQITPKATESSEHLITLISAQQKSESTRHKTHPSLTVNEHIIDQMIDQGISVSKETIRKILRNENVDLADSANETTTAAGRNSAGQPQSVNDHHYIKATYHLLKDKSMREFKGINDHGRNKHKQNKRGNFTSRKRGEFVRSDSGQTRKPAAGITRNPLINTQSLSNLEVTPPAEAAQNSNSTVSTAGTGYVLPLARKCSIVSEEGSICGTENSIGESLNVEQSALTVRPPNFSPAISSNSQPHSIDIFVTDASASGIDQPPIRKEVGLHPVSSSPDLISSESELADISASATSTAHGLSPAMAAAAKAFCDRSVVAVACESRNSAGSRKKNTFEIAEIDEDTALFSFGSKITTTTSKLNNVRLMGAETDSVAATGGTENHRNHGKKSASPSMRVIIQSKSLNNIAFVDHSGSGSGGSNETENNRIPNSISTVNIKAPKSDKNDCCSII